LFVKRKFILKTLCALLSCASIYSVSANQVQITEDFNFGSWSPFLTRWQKTVPVCVWNSSGGESIFRVLASGLVSNTKFRLGNDIGDKVAYRLHWRDGSNTNSREKLFPYIESSSVYRGNDSSRCASGPTGFLQLTINSNALNKAPTGIYSDTIVLTISPL